MRGNILAALLAVAFAGCEEDEESKAPESSGADVMTYSNGHPLLTETDQEGQRGVEDEILRLTNEYRVSLGRNALIQDPVARQASRAVARHMRVHGFVAHENPEGDGPGDRLAQVGLEFTAYGENIAWGWDSAAQAFNFWVNSPPHRENLEYPGWTHVGMGFWSGGSSYGTYFAQEFLRSP